MPRRPSILFATILFVIEFTVASTRADAEAMGKIDLQFRSSAFFVADVPGTVLFYETAFGLKLRYMHPSRGYAELETGSTLLAFIGEQFEREATLLGGARLLHNRRNANPIAAQIAFVTKDLARDWERAVRAGATILKNPETKPWGQTTGYLRDINGVIVELCTPSPRD